LITFAQNNFVKKQSSERVDQNIEALSKVAMASISWSVRG
jgi:hypothetical protein